MDQLKQAAQQALEQPKQTMNNNESQQAQRKRLAELLQGRKQTPLKWNEFGNYPLTEIE